MCEHSKKHVTSIDDYIASFPEHTQMILEEIRRIIRESAPGAEETISYQIPIFKLKTNARSHFFSFHESMIKFYNKPRFSII